MKTKNWLDHAMVYGKNIAFLDGWTATPSWALLRGIGSAPFLARSLFWSKLLTEKTLPSRGRNVGPFCLKVAGIGLTWSDLRK